MGAWKIDLRRRVFDWEVSIWDKFLRNIDGVLLAEGTKDRVIWALASSGKFSCMSFKRMIAAEGTLSDR